MEASRIAYDRAYRTLLSWRLSKDGNRAHRARERRRLAHGKSSRRRSTAVVVEKNVVPGELVDTVGEPVRHRRPVADRRSGPTPTRRTCVKLRAGEPWTVTLKALPGKTIEGKIRVVGAVVDPTQHTAIVQGTIPNPGGVLRAGMFATATVSLPPDASLVVVPTSALVDAEDRTFVYVQSAQQPDEFVRREVHVKKRLPSEAFLTGRRPRRRDRGQPRGPGTRPEQAPKCKCRFVLHPHSFKRLSFHGSPDHPLVARTPLGRPRCWRPRSAVVGGFCASQINIEAYPDPTPPIIGITAQNPALSATEMERLVTVPLETAMASIRDEQYLAQHLHAGAEQPDRPVPLRQRLLGPPARKCSTASPRPSCPRASRPPSTPTHRAARCSTASCCAAPATTSTTSRRSRTGCSTASTIRWTASPNRPASAAPSSSTR